ncbi:LysR family transcriptional regulator [Legionella cincinnatiensis]|uniref:LysR family transcriptional regulator n=1 Tax=Legionella cincinnatiensis TaxID=28085 RepID=A0A378IK58_9GAMM|nr:LysR family transcriptional regulator [Legionella cincinnatiensis]KTC89079.1 LysR family transcriptional regulator [Legionella cincinnatiensis]STX35456.1 LysR family transcriptional regulator [Legionella cincinnatiensis]
MNITDLQSFLAVVELHSISLAAKKLHITQPALSKRIKKLESEWNTQLFISSGLRTELTEKGKQLLPYVRQMMHLNTELLKNTGKNVNQPQMLLNLGTTAYVAKTIVPPMMIYMSSLGLNYFINTNLTADKDVVHSLKEGGNDLIISPFVDNTPETKSIRLWSEKLIFVVGPSHPLAKIKEELSLAELAEFDAILMEKNFMIRKIIDKEVEKQKLTLKIRAEANIIYNNIALVEYGMGWCIIFERLLNPNLIPLRLANYTPTIDFYCHFLKKRADERLIRIFVDNLVNWVSTASGLSLFTSDN